MEVPKSYKPGVCNINSSEARTRRETGYLGLVFTVVMFTFLKVVHAPLGMFALLLPAVWISALGFLQGSHYFCIRYGYLGIQNAYRSTDDPARIMSEEARGIDKKKSYTILTLSVLAAFGVTAILVIIAAKL